MSYLPVLGAALTYEHVNGLKDWIFEKDRALELQDFCQVEVVDDEQDDLIAAYKTLLDGYKGELGIHGPFYGLDLSAKDPLIQNVVQVRLLDALSKCEKLGATHLVVHSPFTFWHSLNFTNFGKLRETMFESAKTILEPVLNRAENIGCTVMLENLDDAHPALRSQLVMFLNSPNLKVSVDTGHAQLAHGQYKAPPVTDFLTMAGELLGHVHLQDADGYADRHWHPGEGTLPWPAIFKTLAEINASPRLIVEVRDRWEQLPYTVKQLEERNLAQ